jgi:arylsulfatase A
MRTLLALFLSASAVAAADPPNVVLFLADDLGWGDLGCYGHPIIKTPHLDAFAKQGAKLTQCYSASAVCSPSRSALLTGRTPHRNGVYTWLAEDSPVYLRKEETTAPEVLKAAGYATCHAGKWHLNGKFNNPDQPQPNDHGYDHWFATQNNAAPSHKNPTNFVRNGKKVGAMDGYSALLVADEAVNWLKNRDAKKPFFLAVWTHEPHLPIESDPELQKLYAEEKDADVRQHHANVTQMDAAFGRVMKALDDLKLADTTFVFFTSDNGPEGDGTKGRTRGSTGGLRGRKRAVYEGGIRVPGLVRWPGQIKAGSVIDAPVIGSDFFPTALAAAGVKPPKDVTLDGANLLPLLTGKADTVERTQPLYWRLDMAPNDRHVAFRDGDWKLVADKELKTFELYNLKADPKEATDVKETEAKRFETMQAALEKHQAAVVAEGPDWWKKYTPNGAKEK